MFNIGHLVGALVSFVVLAGCASVQSYLESENPVIAKQGPHVDRLVSIPEASHSERRLITVDDLLSLRDIVVMKVSPDGESFAILVRQADAASNDYKSAWFVGSTRADRQLVRIGWGGAARTAVSRYGMTDGSLETPVSAWSPDSRMFAYTLFDGQSSQVWRSDIDGSPPDRVTSDVGDITDFRWAESSRSIYVQTQPNQVVLDERRKRESRNGYLLDRIPSPMSNFEPSFGSVEKEHWVVDVGTRDKSKIDEAMWENSIKADVTREADLSAYSDRYYPVASPDEQFVAAAKWDSGVADGGSRTVSVMNLRDAAFPVETVCEADACNGYVDQIWWSADSHIVIFKKSGGINRDYNGLYAWDLKSDTVRTIYWSIDPLSRCDVGDDGLVCVRETPLQPNHVVSINLDDGKITTIADINPEIASLEFGEVRYLTWNTPIDEYDATFLFSDMGYSERQHAYVIYPPDYDPANPTPVIITPYRIAGFQRGDDGNEQPLLVYAANGFVVLNSSFPWPLADIAKGGSTSEMMLRLYDADSDISYYRVPMNSNYAALDILVEEGLVDNGRVGMGGFSHASYIPAFSLHQSDRLAAASISTSIWEPLAYYTTTDVIKELLGGHYMHSPHDDTAGFWDKVALSRNAKRVSSPVLMNLPSGEALGNVEAIQRVNEDGKIIEAHIYHDEKHNKRHPAHRKSIYMRNLQWFKFWLQNIEVDDPVDADQYNRWRLIRERVCEKQRSGMKAIRPYCDPPQASAPN